MVTGYVQLDCDQNSVGFIHLKTDSTNIHRNRKLSLIWHLVIKLSFKEIRAGVGFKKKTKVAQNHLKDISKILKSDKISPLPTLATVRGPIWLGRGEAHLTGGLSDGRGTPSHRSVCATTQNWETWLHVSADHAIVVVTVEFTSFIQTVRLQCLSKRDGNLPVLSWVVSARLKSVD